MFHLMCVHIFSSVSVAVWPPFAKLPRTRLTICSLCILSICNISILATFWEKAAHSVDHMYWLVSAVRTITAWFIK